jgi:signal transduction histidine kinase
MVILFLSLALGAAGALGLAAWALVALRGAQRAPGDLLRQIEALDPVGGQVHLDPAVVHPTLRPLANRVNRIIASRRLAELAARDAAARSRLGDGRSEQIARELEPALDALRARAEQWRQDADPAMRDAFDIVERELARLDDLLRGVLAVAAAAERPDARADLCTAVRAATRDLPPIRARGVLLDLDERPCPIPGTEDAVLRLATAFLQHALAAGVSTGATAPPVGVYVRRMPRRQLEEPTVRRQGDPGLTIVPRRPNPRLERWLREGQPPAEVVKFIVADAGAGIPADIEKRLYDPAVGGSIGLTTARRVIEQARGTVWVQRAREGGAALHVVLPLAAASTVRVTPRDQTALLATA